MPGVVRVQELLQILGARGGARLVEAWVAGECVDRAVARIHHDRRAGVGVVVPVGMGKGDPVLNGLFGSALDPQIDGQLEAAGRTGRSHNAGGSDRTALGVDDDPRLLEPSIQEPVVGGLGARLPDDRARLRAGMLLGGELGGAHLSQQAQEFAADRAARIAAVGERHDTDPRELSRVLVDEEAEIATDPRQHHGRGIGRPELAVPDPPDEGRRRDPRQLAEVVQ